jgi:hypothetical protein
MLSERRGNLVIFIPFCNMNLLISLHSIFQDEESLGREEEVEATGLQEDLDAVGLEDTSDGGGQDSEEEEGHEEGEEGHEEGAGLYNEVLEGGGVDRSASGSVTSHRLRSIHLVRPSVAPCDDNRVVIIPCGDG